MINGCCSPVLGRLLAPHVSGDAAQVRLAGCGTGRSAQTAFPVHVAKVMVTQAGRRVTRPVARPPREVEHERGSPAAPHRVSRTGSTLWHAQSATCASSAEMVTPEGLRNLPCISVAQRRPQRYRLPSNLAPETHRL